MLKKKNTNFHLSFLILFIFTLLLSPSGRLLYFEFEESSFLKLLFNSYIYITLFFLPFTYFKSIDQFFEKKIRIIFYLIIFYSFLKIVSSMDQLSMYISIFGNLHFGPIFFVPLFLLWGTQVNSIYWFNKISLLSIKIGILLTPICLIFSIPLPISAFLPTYYILSGFNYVPIKDKIWIILGIIVSFYCFIESGYRSGIVMLLLSLLIFFIIKINIKRLNKIVIILLFLIPFVIFYVQFYGEDSIFTIVASYFASDSIWAVDTRTIIGKDVIFDLVKNQKLLFGKGPLGTYYNEYFDKLQNFYASFRGRDEQAFRSTSEIGILHYLIKGGMFYIFLIFIISLLTSLNANNQSKNDYIKYLALYLAVYFMFSAIENPPLYNFKHVSMWIIMAICASKLFLNLKNSEIKELIAYKT
jgi:hypothetical protein